MAKYCIVLVLLLTACSGTAANVPKAETIACTAAYRASVTQGIEREETLLFADTDAEQSIAFTDLVFHAAYRAGEGDNERNVRVWVTDALRTSDPSVFHSTLYQLPIDSGPQNQFVGGHGFTGLTYSYHPESGAELQFWCEVR